MHTYLKRDRDASLPADDRDRHERKVESIEKLQDRLTAVTESTLSSLAAAGELNQAHYDVLVNVCVVCPDCGVDRPVGELLRKSGCGCTD
ncbi:rod-determining factor RdfA [Halorubrum sp. DM2]|uniref:rod-determining factor RdfA n=1 Tax=Halorubrum sp. DM2 TaxID=2527867 RepID=UPI0031F2FFA9